MAKKDVSRKWLGNSGFNGVIIFCLQKQEMFIKTWGVNIIIGSDGQRGNSGHLGNGQPVQVFEGVGGLILITDQRIIFQPYLFNIQRDVVEIPLKEIVDVRLRSTYDIIPNGILIRTRSGQEYKFMVPKRQRIIDLIKQNISPVQTA